jgi:DNA-binding transcriptional ArsR family regulator
MSEQTEIDAVFLSMPEPEALELTAVLDALADPIRLEILRELAAHGESSCGSLSPPIAASTRSHHLKVLRAAGLTRTRVVGTTRFVSLRRDDVDARFPGLLGAVLSAPR